jgi:hypothetical protein
VADAARIALRTVAATLPHHPSLTGARFVLFSTVDLAIYEEAMAELAAELDRP